MNPDAPAGRIEYFLAHPHEGAVRTPADQDHARAIAVGHSLTTGAPFHLVIAFGAYVSGSGEDNGRAIADSSFHHFADYNWDPRRGAPTFVTEPVAHEMSEPRAQSGIRAFVSNAVFWLAGRL